MGCGWAREGVSLSPAKESVTRALPRAREVRRGGLCIYNQRDQRGMDSFTFLGLFRDQNCLAQAPPGGKILLASPEGGLLEWVQ